MARTVAKKRRQKASHTGLIVKDIWGDTWIVAERRPTNYRFAVHMGWPITPNGIAKSGKAAVIITTALARHMRANAQRPYAYPLPIGDNARRRIRDVLGCGHREWIDTRVGWWIDRIDDLGTLSSAKFVAKHGRTGWTRMGTMSSTLVWQMRNALLGRLRHDVGWWKTPDVAKLVLSKTPLEEIARRLGVSPVSVYGIRYRLNKMAGRTRPRVQKTSAGAAAKSSSTATPVKSAKAVRSKKSTQSTGRRRR